MAFNIGEILLSALTGPLATITRQQVFDLLEKFAVNDPVEYAKAVVAVYTVFGTYLVPLAAKTKTSIDDTVLGAFLSAVQDSAAAHGVLLPTL